MNNVITHAVPSPMQQSNAAAIRHAMRQFAVATQTPLAFYDERCFSIPYVKGVYTFFEKAWLGHSDDEVAFPVRVKYTDSTDKEHYQHVGERRLNIADWLLNREAERAGVSVERYIKLRFDGLPIEEVLNNDIDDDLIAALLGDSS